MRVDPTNAPSVQLVCTHKRDHVGMRNTRYSVHQLIGLQQL